MFNISTRKVGGLRFVKIGHLSFSYCITKQYRPLDNESLTANYLACYSLAFLFAIACIAF